MVDPESYREEGRQDPGPQSLGLDGGKGGLGLLRCLSTERDEALGTGDVGSRVTSVPPVTTTGRTARPVETTIFREEGDLSSDGRRQTGSGVVYNPVTPRL